MKDYLLCACLAVVGVLLLACQASAPAVRPSPTVPAAPAPAPSPTATDLLAATQTSTPAATLIPYTTPDWLGEAVMYEIFVRSFADSDGDGIGDLNGITERLDYLEALGVNVLWLMPIHPSPSVHGYDVADYQTVNPQYGTLEDLQALVEAAHARGMRLLLDFVPSHLSNEHPFFLDALGNPGSPYSPWFAWTNDAQTRYASFAGNDAMPRFNHYNPEVVEFLSEVALFWLDLDGDGDYQDGVDGFRVDNATFPPQEFFISLRQRVKAANPQALLLGEIWVENPADLSRFFEHQFDALFNFPLYTLLQGNHDFNADGLLAGQGFPSLVSAVFQEAADRYPPGGRAVHFLSNHDTNRIASEVNGDPDRLRMAAALLAALPGPIKLYYGEELGMPGQKGGPPHWDSYRREPMDWYAAGEGSGMTTWFQPRDGWNQPQDGVSVEEQEGDPDTLLNFYRHVLALRQDHPALTYGAFAPLALEAEVRGPWAFVRFVNGETLVGLFNFSDQTASITLPEFPLAGTPLIDLLTGQSLAPVTAGEALQVELPASGALLVAGNP